MPLRPFFLSFFVYENKRIFTRRYQKGENNTDNSWHVEGYVIRRQPYFLLKKILEKAEKTGKSQKAKQEKLDVLWSASFYTESW